MLNKLRINWLYSLNGDRNEICFIDAVFIPEIQNTSKIDGQFYFQYVLPEEQNKTILRMR